MGEHTKKLKEFMIYPGILLMQKAYQKTPRGQVAPGTVIKFQSMVLLRKEIENAIKMRNTSNDWEKIRSLKNILSFINDDLYTIEKDKKQPKESVITTTGPGVVHAVKCVSILKWADDVTEYLDKHNLNREMTTVEMIQCQVRDSLKNVALGGLTVL